MDVTDTTVDSETSPQTAAAAAAAKTSIRDCLACRTSRASFFSSSRHPSWMSGYNALRLQFFGVIIPLGGVTWLRFRSIPLAIAAILSLPTIAILQGALAIAKYRIKYGDSPLPKAPSHGVVKTICEDETTTTSTSATTTTTTTTTTSGLVSADSDDAAGNAFGDAKQQTDDAQTPVRLLVIGDSLAIGVGQSKNATPVMPETIAHELSLAMNGRPVLWTCHGAPGASAGWIVRELEQSIKQHGRFQQPPGYGSTTSMELPRQPSHNIDGSSAVNEPPSTSSSSSSLSSANDESPKRQQQQQQEENYLSSRSRSSLLDDETMQTWQERLRHERVHFDANVVGPFDIAVVLTGSNDLKSEFFPFLLKEEDAEFRRQAQMRGGSYGDELSRLLNVLNQRMRMRLQTFRESVEAARDKMRERLGSYDSCSSSSGRHQNQNASSQTDANGEMTSLVRSQHDDARGGGSDLEEAGLTSSSVSSFFPMVVLPGMPARSLPIFYTWPLRWLAVPVVDIMDSHKRNLAKLHPGEVLFVDAPPTEDLTDFTYHTGKYWSDENQQRSRTLFNLKSLKRRQARRIEDDMHEYYLKQKDAVWDPDKLPERKRHFGLFSVDGIHPNDEGYKFWGRFISDAIVQQLKQKQAGSGVDLITTTDACGSAVAQ